MKRFLYILAEFVTLYLIMVVLGGGLIWATMGLEDWGAITLIIYLVVTLGWSLKAVTVGPGYTLRGSRMANWALFGVYRPLRPLAFILPAIWVMREDKSTARGGNRQMVTFRYDAAGAPDVLDVMEALANEITAQGVTCTRVGHLVVRDGSTEWRLEPVLGEPELRGWIQSNDPRDREQTHRAIRDFLVDRLKLTLVE